MNAENWPVPCISGQHTIVRGGFGLAARARGDLGHARRRRHAQQRVAGRADDVEQVVLAPHHALRHAGRAAGVEEQQVVAAARRRRCRASAPDVTTASYGVAQSGPAPASSATTYQRLTPGSRSRMPSSELGERGVEHDGLGVGVVEQVVDLVGAVAEVRVDRHERALERGDHGLEVLGPVVQVAGDLRLVPEAGGDQVGGQRVGAPIELAPRDDACRRGSGTAGRAPRRRWLRRRRRTSSRSSTEDRSRSGATVRGRTGRCVRSAA